MLVGSWVVGLALATWFFSELLIERTNPNRDPSTRLDGQRVEVVLQANRAAHYVATGSINGRPVTFLLDTGATDVVVPLHLAEPLGLGRGAPARAQTANGTITVYRTVLSELRLGGIQLQDVRASLNPGMRDDAILLGMSALKDLELSQRGGQLTLRQYRP